jgi:hypothetical protein
MVPELTNNNNNNNNHHHLAVVALGFRTSGTRYHRSVPSQASVDVNHSTTLSPNLNFTLIPAVLTQHWSTRHHQTRSFSFQFHSISGLAPMQPATPSILYSSSPPFTPRTIPFTPCIPSRHSRPPLAFVDPQAISKKRLRAMRLFPLSLQFTPLNSYESAYCRIKRREIKKRVRQLALLREEREQLARMALDTVQCAKALFKNISHLIHSISVGEDTRDDHPSQSRKRKREAG